MLEADGYSTHLASTLEEVQVFLRAGVRHDLVVLCHTVDNAERNAIQAEIEQSCQHVPVYAMTTLATPLEFIKEVSHLTGKSTLVLKE